MKKNKESTISFFSKYLTIWVIACIIIGMLIGKYIQIIPQILSKFEYFNVSLPIAILIWFMIFPMMLKIDFNSIVKALKNPKGLAITTITNWLIKPFTMYLIAALFFKYIFKPIIPTNLASEYLAGAILLGAAPCTAMVFVWSKLTNGDSAYTLVQVAINDLILLFAFTPIVALLLGISNVIIPYNTLFLSVIFFIVTPLITAFFVRKLIIKKKNKKYFNNHFIKQFDNITEIGLLLTLTLIFSFQGEVILNSPINIILIAIPLIIQTFLIFGIAYLWSKLWRIKHNIAAPAALIGSSNFFELAVAVAISLFGLKSGAVLVTVVGVLVEVPLMLTLVQIANKTKSAFKNFK